MDYIELTKKNANFINKTKQSFFDAMAAVQTVYATFPEQVQAKYHNLYESIQTELSEALHDYEALGSYLLSDATLRMLTVKKEEEK